MSKNGICDLIPNDNFVYYAPVRAVRKPDTGEKTKLVRTGRVFVAVDARADGVCPPPYYELLGVNGDGSLRANLLLGNSMEYGKMRKCFGETPVNLVGHGTAYAVANRNLLRCRNPRCVVDQEEAFHLVAEKYAGK